MDPSPADFAVWLRAVASRAGIASPEELMELLVAEASPAPLPSVTGWFDGTVAPSEDRKRELINVLNRTIPGADVWDEYRAFLAGEAAPSRSAEPKSLQEVVRSGGLPPPLEDDADG